MADENIWVAMAAVDLAEVLDQSIISKADANTGTLTSGLTFDPAGATRSAALVAQGVTLVRSSIRTCGRYPLAVAENTVPPLSRHHILNWAAWKLVNGKQNLQTAIITDKGVWSPMQKAYELAEKYFEDLLEGQQVETPTVPTGVDYLNEVSDTNPAICGVKWGDCVASDTDYARGYKVDPVNGVITYLPADKMSTT